MTCNVPPFARFVLTEASGIAPSRRTSSDGVCADARHYQTGGDHVPSGPNNYAHAVDVSHSVPGAPFWEPQFGQFDAMAYGRAIADRMAAGVEKRPTYLVANFGGYDQIFHPSVHGNQWVQNGAPKTEHRSHLHVSFTVDAEQSVAPFFAYATPEDDMTTEAQVRAIVEEVVKKWAATIMDDTHKILDQTVQRIGNYFPDKSK